MRLVGAEVFEWSRAERAALAKWRVGNLSLLLVPRRRLAAAGVAMAVLFLGIIVLPATLTSGLLLVTGPRWWALWPGSLAVGGILGLAQVWGFASIARWAMAKQIADSYISIGRCASCGYPLDHDLPPSRPSDTGLTVCAECGAAWHRPLEHLAAPAALARNHEAPCRP